MITVHNIIPANADSAELFCKAVDSYPIDIWGKIVTRERFPLDALVFAEHQTPWIDFEQYKTERLKYDDQTNNWLRYYVLDMAEEPDELPPVLLRLTDTGVALVDGCHRVSALLMLTNEIRIDSWVIR